MATLNEVIEAVLKDVAQARAEADQFSANLAKAYKEHPILKTFPVPRLEFNDIEVDLRFAYLSPPVDNTVVDQFYDPVLSVTAETLVNNAFIALRELDEANIEWMNALNRVYSQQSQINIKREVLLKLLEDLSRLKARNELWLEERLPLVSNALQAPINKDPEAAQQLQRYKGAMPQIYQVAEPLLRELFENGKQIKLDPVQVSSVLVNDERYGGAAVEVKSAVLATLPTQSVSQFNFATRIDNYQWEEAENPDTGQTELLLNKL